MFETSNTYQGAPTQSAANLFAQNRTAQAQYDAMKSEFPRLFADAQRADRGGVRAEGNRGGCLAPVRGRAEHLAGGVAGI